MWTCPKCHSKVDDSFEICWSCGTTPDGVEDPTFTRADDDEPIDDASAAVDNALENFEGPPLDDAIDYYIPSDTVEWTCPKCHSMVEDSFEVCWSCGTTRDGVEDPTFIRADEAGAIEDPLETAQPPVADELDDFGGTPLPDLVVCYVARNTLEAKFVADRLVEEGIPAVSDSHDIHLAVAGLQASNWSYGPKVRVQPKDLARARAWIRAHEEHRKSRSSDSD